MLMLKKGDAEMLMLKQIGEIKIPYGEYKDAVLKALDDIGVKYCNANLSIDGWTIKVYDEDKEN